jgi:hypothetical protein
VITNILLGLLILINFIFTVAIIVFLVGDMYLIKPFNYKQLIALILTFPFGTAIFIFLMFIGICIETAKKLLDLE